MILSTRICEDFVYDTLLADAEMTALVNTYIWAYEVGISTTIPAKTPYVLYANLSSRDRMGVGPYRLLVDSLYVVRGVVEDKSFKLIEPVADRIDLLLHDAEGMTPYGQLFKCVRDRAFVMPELSGTRHFRHLGGVYRFWTE